jgi:hypothetical protein
MNVDPPRARDVGVPHEVLRDELAKERRLRERIARADRSHFDQRRHKKSPYVAPWSKKATNYEMP